LYSKSLTNDIPPQLISTSHVTTVQHSSTPDTTNKKCRGATYLYSTNLLIWHTATKQTIIAVIFILLKVAYIQYKLLL